MYTSTRSYCAGCITSAIAYFAFILLVSDIESNEKVHKAAGLKQTLKEFKQAFLNTYEDIVHAPPRTLALWSSGLAFCGSLIQLGAMAALTDHRCRDGHGQFAPFPEMPGASSNRRLLDHYNVEDLELRCAFNLSMEW